MAELTPEEMRMAIGELPEEILRHLFGQLSEETQRAAKSALKTKSAAPTPTPVIVKPIPAQASKNAVPSGSGSLTIRLSGRGAGYAPPLNKATLLALFKELPEPELARLFESLPQDTRIEASRNLAAMRTAALGGILNPALSVSREFAHILNPALSVSQPASVKTAPTNEANGIPEPGTMASDAPPQPAGDGQDAAESDAASAMRHGPDFRSLAWGDAQYAFTPSQAAVVKVLWEARDNRTPDVGEQFILEAVDSCGSRLRDIFSKNPAWGTLILTGKTKGTFRLAE